MVWMNSQVRIVVRLKRERERETTGYEPLREAQTGADSDSAALAHAALDSPGACIQGVPRHPQHLSGLVGEAHNL